MYVVGGATLVASLLNEDLIDELRLIVPRSFWGKAWRSSAASTSGSRWISSKQTRPSPAG